MGAELAGGRQVESDVGVVVALGCLAQFSRGAFERGQKGERDRPSSYCMSNRSAIRRACAVLPEEGPPMIKTAVTSSLEKAGFNEASSTTTTDLDLDFGASLEGPGSLVASDQAARTLAAAVRVIRPVRVRLLAGGGAAAVASCRPLRRPAGRLGPTSRVAGAHN